MIAKGVMKLEKKAKSSGGDKYQGSLKGDSGKEPTFVIYLPQQISRVTEEDEDDEMVATSKFNLELLKTYTPTSSSSSRSFVR